MWKTPEDCTAVVRVMQEFEKLAGPHQDTNTVRGRLTFDETPSPNADSVFYASEKRPSGGKTSESAFPLLGKTSREREKDVALLCARGRISQLESESYSMATERKRARIEQEKEAEARQSELRRQIEKNSELHQQLKYLVDEDRNAREELKEKRKEFEEYKKKAEERIHSLQRQKLKLGAEFEELKDSFNKQLAEMRENLTRQEVETVISKTKLEENENQLDFYKKRYSEAGERVEELEEFQSRCLAAEHKLKELEQKLARREEAVEMAVTMQSQISKYYDIERENLKLRDENSYLKATNKSNLLLEEKLNSRQSKLKKADEKLKSFAQMEFEYEKLKKFLKKWEVEGTAENSMKSRDELLQEIARLQQSNVVLLQKQGEASASARVSSDALRQKSEECLDLKVKLSVVEEKYNEQSEQLKRVNKLLSLVTTERDGCRRLLNSYDNSDMGNHAPKLSTRLQQAEEQLQASNAHVEQLEKDFKVAIEKASEEALKYNKLKIECDQLKERERTEKDEEKLSSTKQDEQQSKTLKDISNTLKFVVKYITSSEASKIREVDKSSISGDFDPSEVKVLHFSHNPFMRARQSRSELIEQLKEECESLRRKVKMLEEGDKSKSTTVERIVIDEASPRDVIDLKAQVSSAERKNQRLKEVFSQKIQEFREACYTLTGYRIDVVQDQQYRLKSMYAERSSDSLLFQCNSNGKTMLLETDFSRQVTSLIDNYLMRCNSIPAFLSSVTLELFERQTQMIN